MPAVTVKDIGWGSYGGYEGPYYAGNHLSRVFLPAKADTLDKYLQVVAVTEGSNYAAINMYDRMIISVGAIQWGEAIQCSVSNMLGGVATTVGIDWLLSELRPALDMTGAVFKKNSSDQWRFFVDGVEVKTLEQQKQLFLGCSGRTGAWTPEAKERAKTWAACIASIFSDQRAQIVQREFTKKRILSFATEYAYEQLFAEQRNDDWAVAVRAIYISFAANIPATAHTQLKQHVDGSAYTKWSQDWCISLIKKLTFGPGIGIYPKRYDKLAPIVMKLWNVTIPATADELQTWEVTPIDQPTPTPVVPVYVDEPVPPPPPMPVIVVRELTLFERIVKFILSFFKRTK